MAKKHAGLDRPPVGILARVATADERADEARRRLCALADECGIPDDKDRWFVLAFVLANRHVPALMYAKPQGRPQVWTMALRDELVTDLAPMLATERTQKQAAAKLAKSPKWREALTPWSKAKSHMPDSGAVLLRQYRIALKEAASLSQALRAARRKKSENNSL